MEWRMLWHTDRLFFPTSAPCWHAPWLLLIIPWTLLFLKSSQMFLLAETASYCIQVIVTLGNQQGRVAKESVCRCRFWKFKDIPPISINVKFLMLKWQQLRLIWNPNRLAAAVGGFPLDHGKSHLQVHFHWKSGLELMIKWYAGEAFLSFFRKKETGSVLFEGPS